VWSADTERARALMALDDAGFMNELSGATEHVLGAVTGIGKRAAFPLTTANAEHYMDERFVLVGDAAHRIHPLAGQGLNLGLADAATLAEVLLEAARQGKDIGSRAVLRRFERWRKGENLLMLRTMDAFKRTFGSTNPLIQGLRNFGFDVADSATPVKNLIMRRAMGLTGDLPQSMRQHR
jgi:2-octaprenylphenol hydroxylase